MNSRAVVMGRQVYISRSRTIRQCAYHPSCCKAANYHLIIWDQSSRAQFQYAANMYSHNLNLIIEKAFYRPHRNKASLKYSLIAWACPNSQNPNARRSPSLLLCPLKWWQCKLTGSGRTSGISKMEDEELLCQPSPKGEPPPFAWWESCF